MSKRLSRSKKTVAAPADAPAAGASVENPPLPPTGDDSERPERTAYFNR
jgi:hypothetical protein